jgi:hypothetical protein
MRESMLGASRPDRAGASGRDDALTAGPHKQEPPKHGTDARRDSVTAQTERPSCNGGGSAPNACAHPHLPGVGPRPPSRRIF